MCLCQQTQGGEDTKSVYLFLQAVAACARRRNEANKMVIRRFFETLVSGSYGSSAPSINFSNACNCSETASNCTGLAAAFCCSVASQMSTMAI